MTVDAAQHFSGDLTVVLFEQKGAKLPGRFTTLSDQLDEFLLGLHNRTNRLRHVLTQNDVLRFAFAQVMYPYPFPGPEIKNADCLRLAAFDDLDLSAQVTEGNGVSAVFETYNIALLHFEDLAYGRQFVRNCRQRAKRDLFFLHEIGSRKAIGTCRQGACVELDKFFADSLVDFFETEELASSQSRQYEALALVHTVLNHRFISRFTGPDSNRNGSVVIAELPVLLAKSRTILVRFDHQ